MGRGTFIYEFFNVLMYVSLIAVFFTFLLFISGNPIGLYVFIGSIFSTFSCLVLTGFGKIVQYVEKHLKENK